MTAFVADDGCGNNRSKGYFFWNREYNLRLAIRTDFLQGGKERKWLFCSKLLSYGGVYLHLAENARVRLQPNG